MTDKKRILAKIVECAELYRDNLVNTNLKILYSDKSIQRTIEVRFLPQNFLHMTGVKVEGDLSSVQFYRKCIDHKLSERDFSIKAPGTTDMKMQVLQYLLQKDLSARLIADFNEEGSFKLSTEKLAGTSQACMGFVLDKKSGYYVPNTVLKTDINKIAKGRPSRILVIWQKKKDEKQYNDIVFRKNDFATTDIGSV